MNVCPDCDSPLPQTATSCRCGWELPLEVPKSQQQILADREREHMERVRDFLKAHGLDRQPGESLDAWRARTLEWMKDKGIKTFGKAA